MSGHNASRVPVAWSAKRERHRPSRVPYERVGRQRRALLRAAVAGEAFAAAHLETAPRALEGAVAPLHRRCTPRAWLDHWLGSRRGGRRRGHAADGTARGGRRVERWVPRYPLGTPTCTGACTPSRPAPRSPAPQPGVAQRSSRTPRREARTEPRQGFILSLQIEEATSGFEPLLPEKADGETQSPEPSSRDVPELNPFLARILERVTENERERSR